jgi:hypothetical protein
VWLVSLLRDLGSLEHLELDGFCGHTLRRLRQTMMRGDILLGVKTLTVRSGTYEIRQALRLKDIADGLLLEIIVTCILDPDVSDDDGYPDADGLSEGWGGCKNRGESNDAGGSGRMLKWTQAKPIRIPAVIKAWTKTKSRR